MNLINALDNQAIYTTSSSPPLSHDICNAFVRPDPRQFSQGRSVVNGVLLARASHAAAVSQAAAPDYSQRIFSSKMLVLSAVAQTPHHTAASPLCRKKTIHQQIPSILSILGLAGIHAYCDVWLLLALVVGYVDERELHMMRTSPGTVDAIGSTRCQSILHST